MNCIINWVITALPNNFIPHIIVSIKGLRNLQEISSLHCSAIEKKCPLVWPDKNHLSQKSTNYCKFKSSLRRFEIC
jgi:hypothetical protein